MESTCRHIQRAGAPLSLASICFYSMLFANHFDLQQGQERLLWSSAVGEAAAGAASTTEADSVQRGGASSHAASPPSVHLRGTDHTLNCDVVLAGDICITVTHVVGRGLRNKGEHMRRKHPAPSLPSP
jgi:hypothetical protein